MYLAACDPKCKVVVYDHSPRQLELGRKWARQRGLTNVRYVQATYRQLAAETGAGGNDLVLFFRGLELRLPDPVNGSRSMRVEPGWPGRVRPLQDVADAMTALARLLSPAGVGVIRCTWSGWGLVHVFEAARRAGLGVDWRVSRCAKGKTADPRLIAEDRLFVRRGMPHLGKCSREDAQAFMGSLRFENGPLIPGL
jgi:hypothetical protein